MSIDPVGILLAILLYAVLRATAPRRRTGHPPSHGYGAASRPVAPGRNGEFHG